MRVFSREAICFDQFEIDLDRRLVLRFGEPLSLNPKALDVLIALVEKRGSVLSKEYLLERIWPGQFVEENNLTVHIAAVRKLLGERKGEHRFIITVPGRGYKFVGEIREADTEIVIEQHKLERIVIEEEGGMTDVAVIDSQAPLAVRFRTIMSRANLILPITALLVATAFGGWLYLSRPNASRTAASEVNAEKLKARIFTTSGGIPHRVAISPSGKLIAYAQRYQGLDTIWLGDTESNNSIQITPESGRIHNYVGFSPEERQIYFTARDDNHLIWTLMRVSIYGGAVQSLTTGVHSSISFSPDGKKFAFIRRDDARTDQTFLIVADADTGKNEQILLQTEKPQRIFSMGSAWSPDGSEIVVGISDTQGENCEITAVNVKDGSLSKIGEKACLQNSNLAWLHDGSGIVVTGDVGDETGNNQIKLISYPAGEVRRITNDTLNYGNYSLSVSADHRVAVLQTREDPKIWLGDATESARNILEGSRVRSEGMHGLDIAPDGKLLYTVSAGDSRTIWEMEEDGTNQRQLTPSQKDSNDTQISATADNRFIVFAANRSGESEIWRSSREGSNLTQLTHGGGNSEPTLTPDGLQIIYTARRDGKSSLWRVSIEGSKPTQIINEEASWAAVSPDGKYIACSYGKAFDAVDKRIAIFPVDGGKPLKILNIDKNGVMFNRLRWSPDSRAIVYKDLVQGLWRQELDAAKPMRLPVPDNYRVIHFDYSAVGKLVYSGVVQMREIVILSNFR